MYILDDLKICLYWRCGMIPTIYLCIVFLHHFSPFLANEQRILVMFFVAHGTFTLVELFSDKLISWVPFYYHMKFTFLVWLQLPSNNQGASHLYRRYIRPFLLKHQLKFDLMLNYTSGETAKFLVTYESQIQFLKDLVMRGARTANQILKDFGLFKSQGREGSNVPTRLTIQDSNDTDN
uniref:HVA22-like protein n=1 Tax=Cymbidium ensifolium TaxID=78740 RepID=A0A3G2CI13_CYMEN|nr:HVA22-like protein k-like transcript variant X3 [Cymbidium ensifolium]